MSEFKLGDVVQLKSGGPLMTVTAIASAGDYVCEWFSGDEPKWREFKAHALRGESQAPAPFVAMSDC